MMQQLQLKLTCKANSIGTINKVARLEQTTCEKRPEGMMELFIELEQTGHCESYDAGRIYYMAYLLAENYPSLKFEVKEG